MKKKRVPEGYTEIGMWDLFDDAALSALGFKYKTPETLAVLDKVAEELPDDFGEALMAMNPTFSQKKKIIQLRDKYNPQWRTMKENT